MCSVSRILVINHVFKRYSSFYSIEHVFDEDNLKKTAERFSNMEPIRLQTHEPFKKAAVLIPMCVVNKKVSLLYTLRAPHLKNHRGQVSFPGGMQDTKDKHLEETALRETEEELGIERKNIRIWGSGKLIVTRGEMCVLPVIGQIKSEVDLDSLIVNRDEVVEVFSVSLEDLCNSRNIGYTQFRNTYSVPVFMGGPRRIWGLTALITYAFLKSLLPTSAYSHRIRYIPSVNSGIRYPKS